MILHNSYIYDQNGVRIGTLEFKIGKKVKTYGTKIIKGIKYYSTGNNKFVKAGNISGTVRKLRRTSWVYNKRGKRIKKIVLKRGKKIRTFGSAVTIHHKKFYIIGKGKYVKKVNFR